MILKCWNGIYGASSFEVIGWQYDFRYIKEAIKYYRDLWACVWVEDKKGNVVISSKKAKCLK